MNALDTHDLLADERKPTPPPSAKMIEKIHEKSYIGLIENFGEGFLDPDTFHRDDTYEIAMLAAQGGFLAAQHSFENKQPSFALVRPPGHHSGRDYAGGFCYFNNIAIAAQNILETKDVNRVAIIDYDVHHGNGTEDIFHKRRDILYISTHQWGIYPGTGHFEDVGEDKGEGFTVNIPFAHGTGDASYQLAFDTIIKPVLTQYKPDMMLISLGTDGHYKDPIATLTLSSRGYLWLADQSMKLANELCDGRIAFMLEGGYHLDALAEVISSTVANFYGKTIPLQYQVISDSGRNGYDVIDNVRQVQAEYWELDE
jgi:acetoin utilization deacetylase AcuC-like enzyme